MLVCSLGLRVAHSNFGRPVNRRYCITGVEINPGRLNSMLHQIKPTIFTVLVLPSWAGLERVI